MGYYKILLRRDFKKLGQIYKQDLLKLNSQTLYLTLLDTKNVATNSKKQYFSRPYKFIINYQMIDR